MHHEAREVVDLHRLAHVKDEDLAAGGHCSGLDDELGGLGDGHEIARDVGMGDRDRAARLICLRKRRTTEPELSRTLPKRTMVNTVVTPGSAASACRTSSARRLLAPMMLVGRTALSVEMSTTRSTASLRAHSAITTRAEDVVAAGRRSDCPRRWGRACRRRRDRWSRSRGGGSRRR